MFGFRPGTLLVTVGVSLTAAIALATSVQIVSTRDRAIADTARELDNVANILAQQTERTLEGIVLVQDSILEYVRGHGIASAEQFDAEMSTIAVHRMLQNKISGLSFADTVAVLSSRGRLLNFARFWPIPAMDFSQRSYFLALSVPGVSESLSEPILNRSTGTWSVYLARKVVGPSGEMIGVVVGAFAPDHFERAFAAIALARGSSIALFSQASQPPRQHFLDRREVVGPARAATPRVPGPIRRPPRCRGSVRGPRSRVRRRPRPGPRGSWSGPCTSCSCLMSPWTS